MMDYKLIVKRVFYLANEFHKNGLKPKHTRPKNVTTKYLILKKINLNLINILGFGIGDQTKNCSESEWKNLTMLLMLN